MPSVFYFKCKPVYQKSIMIKIAEYEMKYE